MIKTLSASLLAAMLAFCVGCVVTPATWQRATSAKLRLPINENVVRGCLLDRSVSRPRVRALVVGYVPDSSLQSFAIGSGETEYVVINLAADGEPVWPFAYRSEKSTRYLMQFVGEAWNDLPEEQKMALSSVYFGHRAFDEGARAVHSRDFVPVHQGPIGIGAVTLLDPTEKHPITFYWAASEVRAGSVQRIGGKEYAEPPYPTETKRLVLPLLQQRTVGGRVTDMLFATVMLPAELALDVVATPMMFGWAHIWGDNPPPFLPFL